MREPLFGVPTLGGRQIWGDVLLHVGFRIQRNVFTGGHRLLDPWDIRLARGDMSDCRAVLERVCATRKITPRSDHLVLCLHGFLRTKEVFLPMTRYLRSLGYEAWALNYPSTRLSLQDCAMQVEEVLDNMVGIRKVSFVCHSMGGMVARALLAREGAWVDRLDVNRVVMIATPNRGAEMAERLSSVPVLGPVHGPALVQLRPELAADLPQPTVRFGLIAGARGDGKGWNPLLKGDDDMTVSTSSVLIPGAEDTWVVQGALHTFIHRRPDVVRATERFLRTGRFLDE